MRHFKGFAIRVEEMKGSFFKRKEQKEIFSTIRVEGDNFGEAQDLLCKKMPEYKMTIAILFPFTEEGMEEAKRSEYE